MEAHIHRRHRLYQEKMNQKNMSRILRNIFPTGHSSSVLVPARWNSPRELSREEPPHTRSPRINVDQKSGKGFHTAPSSRLHDPIGALVENGRFGCSARQIENLKQKRLRQQTGPSKNL